MVLQRPLLRTNDKCVGVEAPEISRDGAHEVLRSGALNNHSIVRRILRSLLSRVIGLRKYKFRVSWTTLQVRLCLKFILSKHLEATSSPCMVLSCRMCPL